jgi:hypothetical protein
LAREIREYFIPDFSCWKDHDLYQEAFERLLKDLKSEKSDHLLSKKSTILFKRKSATHFLEALQINEAGGR